MELPFVCLRLTIRSFVGGPPEMSNCSNFLDAPKGRTPIQANEKLRYTRYDLPSLFEARPGLSGQPPPNIEGQSPPERVKNIQSRKQRLDTVHQVMRAKRRSSGVSDGHVANDLTKN